MYVLPQFDLVTTATLILTTVSNNDELGTPFS